MSVSDRSQRASKVVAGAGAARTSSRMAAAAVACMICSVMFAQANPTSVNQQAGGAAPLMKSPAIADWQTAAGGPMAFEVASIKPSKPGAGPSANFPLDDGDAYLPGGRFLARSSVPTYLSFAWKLALAREQVRSMAVGLPKWFPDDLFDIEARAEGNPTKDQMRLMMQSLLADRFRLALHFETRQVALYALMALKPGTLGPKLVPHEKGPRCDVPGNADTFPARCNDAELETTPIGMRFGMRNATMSDIVRAFSRSFDRPVVDQTDLGGRYDLTLEWAPEPPRSTTPRDAGTESDPQQGPTFQEAFHDQLGLKLESTKGPIQTPVIDHIERPSEN
jgi:bla regulator protein blaR1